MTLIPDNSTAKSNCFNEEQIGRKPCVSLSFVSFIYNATHYNIIQKQHFRLGIHTPAWSFVT